MDGVRGKTALVIGATSGVGKATAMALLSAGWRVTAVARGEEALGALAAGGGPELHTVAADASEAGTAERLLRALPDLVVLTAGSRPRMAPLDEQSWESFSEPWNNDTQAAFHLLRAAVMVPLRAGSTVMVVSSGAAINGSPFSGGYAGAKRMQWLLTGYAQKLADARKLGLRFLTIVPRQMLAGSRIAAEASSAYAAAQGITPAEFMARFGAPLDAEMVGAALVQALVDETVAGGTSLAVTSKGVEAIA